MRYAVTGPTATKPLHAQHLSDHPGERVASRDPLSAMGAATLVGNNWSPVAHAMTIRRTTGFGSPHPRRWLLGLQRQYGNRYAQRVVALARQASGEAAVDSEVESAIERARGGGQALDSGVRLQMQSAFGADFTGVRVHTGPEAHALNRDLNAVAFTTGQDIFFRQGAYAPGSSSGRELLAHELTHVVQQTGPGLKAKLTVSQPGDPSEREANEIARLVMQHEQGGSQGQPEASNEDEEKKKKLHAKRGDEYNQARNRAASAAVTGTRGDVSAPLGGEGEPEDQGDELARGRGPLLGETSLQRRDGGASCARPVNFTLGAASDFGPDAIRIPINWDSSTGNLADLNNCTIREVVNYDAIPNPPFLWTPPNPTILTIGAVGSAQDTHPYPLGLKTGITNPREQGTMVAHQVYQFKCTGPGCSGAWELLPGQSYTITRSVFPEWVRPNPWRYQITITGVKNGSREVEVPKP